MGPWCHFSILWSPLSSSVKETERIPDCHSEHVGSNCTTARWSTRQRKSRGKALEAAVSWRVAEKPWAEGIGMRPSWGECWLRRMWNKSSVAVQARSPSQGPQPVRLWEKHQGRGNQRSPQEMGSETHWGGDGEPGRNKMGLKQWTCGKNWPPNREVRK